MDHQTALQLQVLQKENVRLKRLVADQALDNQILRGSQPPKLVSPERRRRTVEMVRSRLGPNPVLEGRICRVLGQSRSTQCYVRRPPDDDRQLIKELRRWVEWYPRFGSERVHQLLPGARAGG